MNKKIVGSIVLAICIAILLPLSTHAEGRESKMSLDTSSDTSIDSEIPVSFSSYNRTSTIVDTTMSEKINSTVLDALKNNDTVKVEVNLKDSRTNSLLSPEAFDAVASSIDASKISQKFYPEGFVAELTQSEIQALAEKSDVASIAPYIEIKPLLADAVRIVGADKAWTKKVNNTLLTGQGVAICVIDTGVDFTHPDLAAKNIAGGNFDCSSSIDCPLTSNTNFTGGHGTHVAGIVAAAPAASGIIPGGIAKGANIVSLRAFDAAGNSNGTYMKRAVEKCAALKTQYHIVAMNMSIGSYAPNIYADTPADQTICNNNNNGLTGAIAAATSQNIPVVVSAGNDGSSSKISWPSCVTTAIPVSATNKNDTVWSGSNSNTKVKVFAPGANITSTYPGNTYQSMTGTSMAAPMVAGAMALMEKYNELAGTTMTPSQIENLFQSTGEQISTGYAGSAKRLNVNLALNHVMPFCSADINRTGVIDVDDLLTVLNGWNDSVPPNTAGDVNHDNKINVDDLLMVINGWGVCHGDAMAHSNPSHAELQTINSLVKSKLSKAAYSKFLESVSTVNQ